MVHKCNKCKYFYMTEQTKTESRYNGISDMFHEITVDKRQKEACGFSAGGVFLDKEQPRCGEYKE